MRNLLSFIGALLICCQVQAAGNWVAVFDRGEYVGKASYNGQAAAVSEPMTLPAQLYGLAVRVQSYYERARSDINASLTSQLSASGASFVSGSLTGDISLAFLGGPGSRIDMTISGPTYVGIGRGSKTVGGIISVTCTTTLTLSTVTASATYDWYTGAVAAIHDVHLNPSQSTSCSSSIDWIPLVGNLLTNYAEGQVGAEVLGKINGWASQISQPGALQGPSYMGLDAALVVGRYFVNGLDVGAYIKNNFANLFLGRSVRMTVGDPSKYTVVNNRPQISTDRSKALFAASFSDGVNSIGFSLTDFSHYSYQWRCAPGTSICNAP